MRGLKHTEGKRHDGGVATSGKMRRAPLALPFAQSQVAQAPAAGKYEDAPLPGSPCSARLDPSAAESTWPSPVARAHGDRHTGGLQDPALRPHVPLAGKCSALPGHRAAASAAKGAGAGSTARDTGLSWLLGTGRGQFAPKAAFPCTGYCPPPRQGRMGAGSTQEHHGP